MLEKFKQLAATWERTAGNRSDGECAIELMALIRDLEKLKMPMALNEALPIYRVWFHGDLPYSDLIVRAKETIEAEAKLHNISFDEMVNYRAGFGAKK